MTAYQVTVSRTVTTQITVNNATDRIQAESKALNIAEHLLFVDSPKPIHNVLTVDPVPVTADNHPMPVDQMVYWNDPDDGVSSGWYTVKTLPTLQNNDRFDPNAPIVLTQGHDDGEATAFAHEVLSSPHLKGDWLIYSDNEAKLGCGYGYGYWDARKAAWFNRASATRYHEEQVGRLNLPTSAGQDLKWVCDHLQNVQTLDDLSDELAEFCRNYELELQSADEMLMQPAIQNGAPHISLWLNQFNEQWDVACERERAFAAE